MTLKLRRADFHTITRARSVPGIVADEAAMLAIGQALLAPLLPVEGGIRLLGLTLSGIVRHHEDDAQPALPLA